MNAHQRRVARRRKLRGLEKRSDLARTLDDLAARCQIHVQRIFSQRERAISEMMTNVVDGVCSAFAIPVQTLLEMAERDVLYLAGIRDGRATRRALGAVRSVHGSQPLRADSFDVPFFEGEHPGSLWEHDEEMARLIGIKMESETRRAGRPRGRGFQRAAPYYDPATGSWWTDMCVTTPAGRPQS